MNEAELNAQALHDDRKATIAALERRNAEQAKTVVRLQGELATLRTNIGIAIDERAALVQRCHTLYETLAQPGPMPMTFAEIKGAIADLTEAPPPSLETAHATAAPVADDDTYAPGGGRKRRVTCIAIDAPVADGPIATRFETVYRKMTDHIAGTVDEFRPRQIYDAIRPVADGPTATLHETDDEVLVCTEVWGELRCTKPGTHVHCGDPIHADGKGATWRHKATVLLTAAQHQAAYEHAVERRADFEREHLHAAQIAAREHVSPRIRMAAECCDDADARVAYHMIAAAVDGEIDPQIVRFAKALVRFVEGGPPK